MTTPNWFDKAIGVFILCCLIFFVRWIIKLPNEECNYGILYKISRGPYSINRTLLVDKHGKPLTCEEQNK